MSRGFNTPNTKRLLINNVAKAVTGTPLTLGANTTTGSYTITMSAGHGLVAGDCIIIAQNSTNPASYVAKVLSVATNVLTMDTPVDKVFTTASAIILEINQNLNVDGSGTPVVYDITNGTGQSLYLYRMLIHITDGSVMDTSKFGGISALTRGLVFRVKHVDGSYHNIVNIKNNGDFGELAYDVNYSEKAPSGSYGLGVRFTFEKLGAVIELHDGDKFEVIVQDDLTGLGAIRVKLEGRFTEAE